VLRWFHGVQVVGERSWGRQLRHGLFEFRVDRNVKPDEEIAERISLRVFCHVFGDSKILLLHGYDKGKSPSSRRQQREIEVARSRLISWRAAKAKRQSELRRPTQAEPKPASRRRR